MQGQHQAAKQRLQPPGGAVQGSGGAEQATGPGSTGPATRRRRRRPQDQTQSNTIRSYFTPNPGANDVTGAVSDAMEMDTPQI